MSDQEKLHRLFNEIAREAIPERADLWSRLRLRLKPYRSANRHLGWLTLSAVVLIVAVFGVLLNLPPRNPFAASTGTPTVAPSTALHSYRGMMLARLTNIDEVAIKPSRGGEPFVNYQIYVWYQQPDQLRLEFYRTCALAPILYSDAGARRVGGLAALDGPSFQRCPQPEKIMIVNGGRATYVNVEDGSVLYQAVIDTSLKSPLISYLGSLMTTLQLTPSKDSSEAAIHLRYGDGYEQLQIKGEGEIMGRATTILTRRGIIPTEHQPGYLYEGDNLLWLDRNTLIPLAGERWLESQVTISSWRFQSFEPNVENDPSLFVYLPGRRQVTYAGVQAAWQELAEQAPFSLYFPSDEVLNGLGLLGSENFQVPQFPQYVADERMVQQDFLYSTDPTKIMAGLTMWQGQDATQILTIAGFPPDQIAAMSQTDLSEAAQVSAGTLIVRIASVDDIRWLAFVKDQTAVVLRVGGAIPTPAVAQFAAAILNSDQVVKNAPAAATPTPIPQIVQLTPSAGVVIPTGKVALVIFHSGLQTRSVLKYGDQLELTVTYLYVELDTTYAAPVTPTFHAPTVVAVAPASTPSAVREATTTFHAILLSTQLPDNFCKDGVVIAPTGTVTVMPPSTVVPIAVVATAYPNIIYATKPPSLSSHCDPSTALIIAVDPTDAIALAWTMDSGIPIRVKKVE
ncbi:MAG: hypothetical protein KF726_11135 [Anaerolineae bacterium]|nr:hypothetical protein [Anaerolineae bacterium]